MKPKAVAVSATKKSHEVSGIKRSKSKIESSTPLSAMKKSKLEKSSLVKKQIDQEVKKVSAEPSKVAEKIMKETQTGSKSSKTADEVMNNPKDDPLSPLSSLLPGNRHFLSTPSK